MQNVMQGTYNDLTTLLMKVKLWPYEIDVLETWNNQKVKCGLCAISYLGSKCFTNTPFSYLMVMVLLSSISSVLTPSTACLSDHKRSVEYESFGSTLCTCKLGKYPSTLVFPVFRLVCNTVFWLSSSAVCLLLLGVKTFIRLWDPFEASSYSSRGFSVALINVVFCLPMSISWLKTCSSQINGCLVLFCCKQNNQIMPIRWSPPRITLTTIQSNTKYYV